MSSRASAMSAERGAARLTVRRPGSDGIGWALEELWAYRDLVFFFALRDISVRYKQTVIGVAWALIQPLCSVAIFTLVFGHFAQLPSSGKPYALYSFCGVAIWMAFATTLSGATMSVVGEQGIIQKVYYPKLASVLAVVGVALVDNAVQWLLLAALLLVFGVTPPWTIILAPVFVVWAALVGVAVGAWLAPINVRYRDVRYVLPFIVQAWLYASPVAYSSELVPPSWMWFYRLNPVTPIIDGYRWAVLGVSSASLHAVIPSLLATALMLIGGIWYFKRMEATFADEI
jgi:lipopolysaccharide transport system permease protein